MTKIARLPPCPYMVIILQKASTPNPVDRIFHISTKLSMKHRSLKVYDVYINYDPVFMTYFKGRSTKVAYAFE